MEHDEDFIPSEITLSEGVRRRELNVWLPLGPEVGGAPLGVAHICVVCVEATAIPEAPIISATILY